MLSKLRNIGRIPDLRGKILFTLAIIALYRLGSHVPTPGINFVAMQELTRAANVSSGGVMQYLQLFSGGAMSHFAVFGLGIMPYITSSIVMQLLTQVIPKLVQWRDEGVTGQKKITQTTRYLTLVLAVLQATSITVALHRNPEQLGIQTAQPLLVQFDVPHVMLIVLSMTAGTALVMWLGEIITQRGIGQGMSILIFANVVATIPAGFEAVRLQKGSFYFAAIILISLILLVAIVFVEQGQRRIPVQFAKRIVGRKQYGGHSTYIPLKVNQSGVIPIIFASSILGFPIMFAAALPPSMGTWVSNNLATQSSMWYIVSYGLLIVFFAYFYTRIAFDPVRHADTIRKQGGFVPGIRPGKPTEDHFLYVMNRVTFPGSLWLALIALIPSFALSIWGVNNYPFAGATLLIAVGVALETMKQVDSQLSLRNYEGFLR